MSASPAALGFDFSGIGVVFTGLPQDLSTRLAKQWRPFLAPAPDGPFLRLEVQVADVVDADAGAYAPKAMRSRFTGVEAVFSMPEGEARVETHGVGRISLRRFGDHREYYTLRNLTRAALAWCAPNRCGALLHAAGLVVDGRGFVLVGAEGSGKSTWTALGESAGARVVSDDLVLVDGIGPRVELVGTPFRSDYKGELVPGRYPLAAILFPKHGERPAWSTAGGLLRHARIVANLPFIAEALQTDPRVDAVIGRLSETVPCAELTFAQDSGFIDLLRRETSP